MAESSSEEGNIDMGDEEGGKNWEMGLLRDSEAMSSIEDMGLDMDLTGNLQPINGDMEFGGNEEREQNQVFSAMEAHMSFLDREAMEAMELQASQAGGQSAAASEVDVAAQNLSNSIKTEEGQLSSGTGADSSFFFAAQDSPTMPRGMEEGRVPLWIKWRGRWQAGIQCSLEDCPAQTAKAMPTYGRKSYIVVFFPNSRSFVWTDWQLVCPISESPEPLALGSHESGRNSVADLNAARRYMLRKITTAMLDISDRLPVQAVVDCARDVSFWKDFAKEAAKAVTYQELGAMLMKLKSMILSTFLKEPFTLSCIDEWKHQCETVETAGSMEKLVKELKNAVCWDEVGKLWDELEQTNLDSGWKNWKEDAHCDNPNQSKPRYSSVSVTGHRRTFDARDCTPEGSDGHARSVDAGNLDSEQGYKRLKSEEQELMSNSAEPWEGTSMQQLGIGKNTNISSLSAVIDYPRNSGLKLNNGAAVAQVENKTQTKSARCVAFSDRKGRQCNKYASDGASYCCKHDPAGRTEEQKKGKLMVPNAGGDDSNAVICGGMTKYGRRCTHKARDGSAFCLKHMLQDSAEPGKMITVENLASKPSLAAEFGGAESNVGTPERHGVSHRKRKLEKASVGQRSSADSKVQEASKSASRMAARTANVTRCIGWCRGSSSQCSHRAKPGFSHCEKHLPGSLGYGGKGQEKAYSKDASAKNSNGEDERNISRLKDLIHEYMRARLADDGARNSQRPKSWQKIIDWVLSEVAGNLKASESLYDLITAEMENLKKYFEEEDVMEVQKSLVPFFAGSVDHVSCSMTTPGGDKSIEHLSNVELLKQVSSTSTGHIPRFRCKLCAQEFVELIVLGQHWRGCHKKEAQQYFRGYTCQYCNLPFTNKKGLYRHRNAHHPGISSQTKSSLLALCIICSGQFMNFEDLWQHVICSHPDQLCAFWPVTDPYAALGSASDQWQPSRLEIVEAGKCSHCNQMFATYAELQQHREIVHGDHGHTSLVENPRKAFDTTDELKFKCKICGFKFRLLPDLGRHHQAEHKPVQAMRLKNVKEEAFITGPLEELNSIIGAEKEKKKLQKLDVRRAPGGQFKAEVLTATQQNVGPEDSTIAEIEGYSGPKLEGCPSSKDILAVARSACCKNKLYSVLQKKYLVLPDRLALKAAKLCSEANVRLQFYREGYVCPNGCKEVAFSSTDTKPTVETSFSSVSCFPLLPQFNNQALLDYKAILESKDMVLDESHVVLTAFSGVGENHGNKTVLCEDLSFGRERVPIPCVVDRDAMGACNCPMCVDGPSSHSETLTPWLHFFYVTKRTLDPSLGLDTESSRLGCSCQGHRCSPAKCEHVYLFDNDNTDAQDIYGRPMAGRFPYDSQGCIILEEGYLVYECNSICSCNEDCQNRVLQKGVQVKLEVYKTRHKGWAVRAAQRIARGTFVCEYIGEVLDDCEANKRGERYDKEGCSYLYDIDAHIDIGRRGRPKPFVIDATKFGNVARFINHSCSPNLVNYQVLVESMDCQLAHIGLYATRDIDVGEELAYDYRYKLLPGKGCPCHCGARDCRGRLY